MEPLSIALGIAKLTGFDRIIKDKVGDLFGDKTAEKINQVAQLVTGMKTPQEALQQISNDEAALERVKNKLLDQEHEIVMAAFTDVNSAREMYRNTENKQADVISSQVMKQNHWFLLVFLAIDAAGFMWIDQPAAAAAIGSVCGFCINSLVQERQQIIGFFFGSSLGSKLKDKFRPMGGA